MIIETQLVHRVPNDLKENLKWRRKIFEAVKEKPSLASEFYAMCAEDPIFYINSFVWTYRPKQLAMAKYPMILYPYQVEGVREIFAAIGDHDLLIKKSRDMGASWCCGLAFEWAWHFKGLGSYLFVSYKEELVDKSDNPKSLFWKLDFTHMNMPDWLMPEGWNRSVHRKKMSIVNPVTGSTIDGESTTKNTSVGDRRTAILFDEFALVEFGNKIVSGSRDVTDSRIFNSTPRGTGNAYYDLTQTGIRTLTFHWSLHPDKSRGLYHSDNEGNLQVIDKEHYPANYAPILDGKMRSPWYDDQCARALSKQEIAQELDIDFTGSGSQFFTPEKVEEIRSKNVRSPFLEGELNYGLDTAKIDEKEPFMVADNGRFQLWMLLDKEGRPPKSKYKMGIDVSSGSGASNSSIAVWDERTCEKVMEYCNPYARPEQLAVTAVAVANWLDGKPQMIWENQGPGSQFGAKLLDLGYYSIYYKTQEMSVSHKQSDVPGWGSNRENKLKLLGRYRNDLENGIAINRSREALDECLEYIYDNAEGVCHARSKNKDDPSGASKNHGDRVMADALGWKLVVERHRMPKEDKQEIPVGSLAWRQQMREQSKQRENPSRQLGKDWYQRHVFKL